MATLAVTGRIAPRSRPAAMYVGGAVVEPTRTPLGEAIAVFLATDPEPCPVCGRFDCDLDEWHDLMHCDVAGDLSELKPEDLPY